MTWSSPYVKGQIPVPRDSHSSVSVGTRIFIYGGDCGNRYNGDVDVLDTCSMTWSRMDVQGSSSPEVRAGHAMVNVGSKARHYAAFRLDFGHYTAFRELDRFSFQVYVVGGVGDKCYYNDVWVLDVIITSHGANLKCGEDERPLGELLLLKLGAGYHPSGKYNISACTMFKGHWDGKRRFL
ncbi:hypothetical protein QQ045_002161 [Rhodiola kirilowii]